MILSKAILQLMGATLTKYFRLVYMICYRVGNFRCIWNGFTHELCINTVSIYFILLPFLLFIGKRVHNRSGPSTDIEVSESSRHAHTHTNGLTFHLAWILSLRRRWVCVCVWDLFFSCPDTFFQWPYKERERQCDGIYLQSVCMSVYWMLKCLLVS